MSASTTERPAIAVTADPLPPVRSFELADLPALTSDYLHAIEVRVTRVTDDLVSPQRGSFSVQVTNGPVQLSDWTLHLTSTAPAVATIVAEGTPLIVFREGSGHNDPIVPRGEDREHLYASFSSGDDEPNSLLEANEVRSFRFNYLAKGPGDGTFEAHLHATVDLDALFPRARGTDGAAEVTVKRPLTG